MGNAFRRTLLTRFMPGTLRAAFENVMTSEGLGWVSDSADGVVPRVTTIAGPSSTSSSTAQAALTMIDIGGVQWPRNQPLRQELVPRTLFYEIPQHVRHLRDMVKDWVSGERHMLLIGNQGVGKNKLSDHLLSVLQLEREYMQLHRDSTVQALTVTPSLVGGVLVYEDSPLVRAVAHGRTLLLDEADKAPVEVVAVLKGLVEDGHMTLADGRRIVNYQAGTPFSAAQAGAVTAVSTKGAASSSASGSIIVMHPAFRMIVLANRPGYPFLGNDFYRECGDLFSVHVIDNPDRESELALLRAYGPAVPEALLRRLIDAFGSLRQSVEEGVFTYPYSTRELVAIVKHLQQYPRDGLLTALENVLSFDVYDSELVGNLHSAFRQHGIPLSLQPYASTGLGQNMPGSAGQDPTAGPVVALAPAQPLTPPVVQGQLSLHPKRSNRTSTSSVSTNSTSAGSSSRSFSSSRAASIMSHLYPALPRVEQNTRSVHSSATAASVSAPPVSTSQAAVLTCPVEQHVLKPRGRSHLVDMRTSHTVDKWLPGRFDRFTEEVLAFQVHVRSMSMEALYALPVVLQFESDESVMVPVGRCPCHQRVECCA